MSRYHREPCSAEPPWSPAAVDKARLGTTPPLSRPIHPGTHVHKTNWPKIGLIRHLHGTAPLWTLQRAATITTGAHRRRQPRLWLRLDLPSTVHHATSRTEARCCRRNELQRARPLFPCSVATPATSIRRCLPSSPFSLSIKRARGRDAVALCPRGKD